MHGRFRKDLISSREGLTSLDARLDGMQVNITASQASITALQAAVATLEDTTVPALQAAIDALELSVAANEAEILSIRDVIHENGYVLLDTALAEVDLPTAIGAFYWDQENDTASLNLSENVKWQAGEEMYTPRCTNKTGVDIPNGSVVYVSGAQGNRPTIALADASDLSNAEKVLGITTETIPNNQHGRVTIHGKVRGLNTNAYAEGTCLYLDTSAGDYVDSTPAYGNMRIKVGMVVKSHPTDGHVCVNIHNNVYMFGNPAAGNYSYFDDNGHLINIGAGKGYLDEFGPMIAQNLYSPAGKIDYNFAEGTVDFQDSATPSDYVIMNTQINHDWDQVTALGVHGHWFQNQNAVPNAMVQYRWQLNGGTKVTSWTDLYDGSNAFAYSSGTILQITDLGDIAVPEGIGVSSILQIRFIRDTANATGHFAGADPYTGDAAVLFLDVHKRVDRRASRTEYAI